MKLLRLIVPLLLFLLGISACSQQPGPLAAGNSRIKVHCSGFDLNSHVVYVTDVAAGKAVYDSNRDLTCIFSGNVYIDVPVPPSQYNVYIDNNLYELVTFSSAGVQTTVNYSSYLLVYSSST